MESSPPPKPPANSRATPERILHRSEPTTRQLPPPPVPVPAPPDETPPESIPSTATPSSTLQSPPRRRGSSRLEPAETRAEHAVPPAAPARASPHRAWPPPPAPV